jgi:beta propeller repeat protein
LLYAAIKGGAGGLFLQIFDARTGDEVYGMSTNTLIGPLTEGGSAGGWGFSPDSKNATFLLTYLTDVNTYALYVVNLTKKPHEYIIQSPVNQHSDSRFLFSPCGDHFAWIYESSLNDLDGRLYRTNTRDNFKPFGAVAYWHLYSAADGQYIKFKDGSSDKIEDNTADDACPDIQRPTWGADKMIDTDRVEGVTMELKWNGDSDNVEVTDYRVYKDGKLYKEIEAGKKKLKVTGLKPLTSYNFKVEAGDEAGNWSNTGPVKSFSTFADNPPYWTDFTILSSNNTETKVTLKWKAANDDYGIRFYRIMEGGKELARVGKDTLQCRLKELKAGEMYNFIVEAGDEAGQWTAGPEITLTMPLPVAPTWPAGTVLRDSLKTETSFILKWPNAYDYYDAITGYEVWMNDKLLVTTKNYMFYWAVTELEAGTVYSCKIIAIDESGNKSEPLSGFISTLPSYMVDKLISAPGNQKQPDIDGNIVVWWDNRNDEGDIYSINLQTDSIRRITANPFMQYEPAVSGMRIVWTDMRNGNKDIYMYDPVLGEVPVCTANGDQDMPAIDGDIIVWRDTRSREFDVYMFDLVTMTESAVCTRTSNQNWPDVSGKYIVYADDRRGNWDIFMYSIDQKKEFPICTKPGNQTNPVITGKRYSSLAISYMDERDIYIYYPFFIGGGGKEFLIPVDQYPFISRQAYPHLEDKQLVYQDLLGAGDGVTWSIYALQFRHSYVTSGLDKTMKISVSQSANQTNPRTSKGNIVWEHEENGNTDIYIWKRPSGSDLQLSVEEITDPLMVGDTLKYILKVSNNGPNNNYFIKTTVTLPLMAKFISALPGKGKVDKDGLNITWSVDTLQFEEEAWLEISMLTFDLAVLEFNAVTEGGAFELDPSNNQLSEKTKVKNVFPRKIDEGGMPAMVVEDNGKVHLAYFRDNDLMYAWKNRNSRRWEFRKLDTYNNAGPVRSYSTVAMAMAPDNKLHCVFGTNYAGYDVSGKEVYLPAIYHGVLTSAGVWDSKIIGIDSVHSLSLDVSGSGELYLAWQDAIGAASMGAHMFRKTINGVWQPAQVVIESGYDHIDLTVDKEDNAHLSFYNLDKGFTYQKRNGTTTGPIELIEPNWKGAQLEGMVTSVVTDNNNNPHISYVGQVKNDWRENIKHAWKKDGVWQNELVDDGSFQSSGNRVALDSSGTANFGYSHHLSGQLRFAAKINGQWVRQIVADEIPGYGTGADLGWELEMEMDKAQNGHMALPGVNYVLIPPLEYFIVDPDTLDFGGLPAGSSKTLTIKISNPSDKDIDIGAIEIDDPRFTFSKTAYTLPRLEEDSIAVTFTQNDQGARVNTRLRIMYKVPSGLMIDVPVIVKPWQPELVAEPEIPDFGAVPLYTTAYKTLILRNEGVTDLVISEIIVFGYKPGSLTPLDFSLISHNCSTLAPGQSCNVQLAFRPSKTGLQGRTLVVKSNDPDSPLAGKFILMMGKTPVPQISTSHNTLDLGYCQPGKSVTDTLLLTNTGDAMLNIYNIAISGTDSDQFNLNGTCSSVSVGESCILTVRFTPTRAGNFNATLTISSNSQYNNNLTIPLQGTTHLSALELSQSHVDFGRVNIGEESFRLLTYHNTGATIINATISVVTGDSYEFRLSKSPLELLPGLSRTDTIWFNPVYDGSKMLELSIRSNDSDEPVKKVVLTGQAGDILPLQATFITVPESGIEPLTVQFWPTVSGGQPPYSYLWDFDDLNTSTVVSPAHEFSSVGVYTITMSVKDIQGLTLTKTIKVAVGAGDAPVVIANAEPACGDIPLMVQFSAMAMGGDPPLTYLWEFGDGVTSTQTNPVHWFSFQGTFLVKVTVTNNNGARATDSVKVHAINSGGTKLQTIDFKTGWNIFSVNVVSGNSDLKSLFHSLIDDGSLIKVQDETGNSLEDWGIFGGWTNNIGNLKLTKGYKVKVKNACQLKILGVPVNMPFNIPLKTGWNITSYPQSTEVNAQSIVQQLIDRGNLVKVQDESGNSLEDWGIFGGWTNNIGNFVPGKGYKIKIRANDTLTIFESYIKNALAATTNMNRTTHFLPEFEGNGIDHMNINLVDLPVGFLQSGDELAVFDGEVCVGAISLQKGHLAKRAVSIPVSATDMPGMPGFTEMNAFTVKLWDTETGDEFVILPEIIKGTPIFMKHETTIASLEKYGNTGFSNMLLSNEISAKCYPNPFTNEIYIEVFLPEETRLTIDILAQDGRLINQLAANNQVSQGIQTFHWNGSNSHKTTVSSGIYYLRIRTDNKELHYKIVFHK